MTSLAAIYQEILEEHQDDFGAAVGYVETRVWLSPKGRFRQWSPYESYMNAQAGVVARVFSEIGHMTDWSTNELAKPVHFEGIGRRGIEPKKDFLQDDLEWFAKAGNELAKFKGKYVAIYDKRIVGSGKTSTEALHMARKTRGGERAAITYVPENEASAL